MARTSHSSPPLAAALDGAETLTPVQAPCGSLRDLLLSDPDPRGDHAAVIDPLGVLTLRDLDDRSRRVGGSLRAAGVEAGDTVAVLANNSREFVDALLGALTVGARVAPLNPMHMPAEAAHLARLARTRTVLCDPANASAAMTLGRALSVPVAGVGLTESLIDALDGEPTTPARVEAEADALLPSSSGTTGRSKVVRLTHGNVIANIEQHRAIDDLRGERVAGFVPFFHVFGLAIVLCQAVASRATVVIPRAFDFIALLDVIETHRITRLHVAPPTLTRLADDPAVEGRDLSSLDYVVCGAAPLPIAVAERAQARLGCPVRQGYGMTEASPGTHFVSFAQAPTTPIDSVGRLLPGTERRIVDPDTGGDSAVGELWIRGPQVMAGYLGDTAATEATLTEDRWLRTGDLVREDEGGCCFVVGRLKEIIKHKGFQVAPAELEAILLEHPSVDDAAVTGWPDQRSGEIVVAFVHPSRPVDAETLIDYVATRVAPYKRVARVEFVQAIPRSPAGKVLRRLLPGGGAHG